MRDTGRRADAGTTMELEDEHALLHGTIDAAPGVFYVFDVSGKLLLWNENVELITGYTADEIRQMNVLQFIRPDEVDYIQERIGEVFRTGSATAEAHFLSKSGNTTPFLFTGKRVQFGGNPCVVGMGIDITEQRKVEARLHHLAHHDPLTNLPNRTSLVEFLKTAIASASPSDGSAALLFIDLDRFKVINDSLGHSLGDEILRLLATRMRACVRPQDMLARLGGDEFVVLLRNVTHRNEVSTCAETLLEVISMPFELEGRELSLTASIGICLTPEDGDDVNVLLRNADSAMYHAKAAGRGCFEFFVHAMSVAAHHRLELDNDLRGALRRNEFSLHYQPFIDIDSDRVVAFEALLRWDHPRLGILSPARFLEYAEDSGIIVPLGNWALREACRTLRGWHDAGFADLNIAVNVSAMQVLSGSLVDTVRDVLDETGLHPRHLELELTESVFLQDTKQVLDPLRRLDRLGVSLVIDDFGIGYSSLGYLKRFPIRKLKIDRSFVAGLPMNRNDVAIVAAMATMARTLDLELTGEGVEMRDQIQFLQAQGCVRAQGFYFSEPVTRTAATALLRAERRIRSVG